MAGNVSHCTKESPRFVGDTLIYYAGDVFAVEFEFDLTRDGEKMNISSDDTIIFEFRGENMRGITGKRECGGDEVIDNVLTFDWDSEWTKEFTRGKYSYRIRYVRSDGITTVAAYGNVIVE